MDDLWATKSEGVGLIVPAIRFQDFQPMWSWITNVTDRQTDGQTTCDGKTALCTVVHRTVKTEKTTIISDNVVEFLPLFCFLECFDKCLSMLVEWHLGQLHSGHCRLLNSYKARITSGISDVCLECGVAPHSVEHLFNCQSHPTQLTVQDLWDNPAAVADFLNLDNWR